MILAAVLIISGTALGVRGTHTASEIVVKETPATEAALFEVYDIAGMQHIGNVEAQEQTEEARPAETGTEEAADGTEMPAQVPSEAEDEGDAGEMQQMSPKGLQVFFENKLCIDPEKVSLYLNVREEPNEDSEILDVLYPDDIVPFITFEDGWYEVQRDGFTGYVNAFYVLAGDAAYEEMKDTVAYAVMAKEDGVTMYENAEDTDTVILYANKGDVFRAVDMDASYYEVSVQSPIYETLVIPKNKVIVYYLFLGPGNSNELTDEAEEAFSKLNIEGNLARTEMIQSEVAARAEQTSIEASMAESSMAQASWEAEYYGWENTDAQAETWETWETWATWAPWQPESTAAPTWTWQPESTAAPTWAWQPPSQAPETAPPAPVPTETAATAPPETAPSTAAPATDGSNLTYVGTFRITHYCHCTLCCGVWGSNDPNYPAHGASGLPLVSDYSVAVNVAQIPYGTRLMINGREYVAADCGVGFNCIDIYRRTHAQASAGGMYYADVYIIN